MPNKTIEGLAEKLHVWYLEATAKLNPESYNPNAQKSYSELTEEQKFIDRYIAERAYKEVYEAGYYTGIEDANRMSEEIKSNITPHQ